MHDLLALYRSALRSGNRPLADALGRVLRRDHELRERADAELQELPRAPTRWSAAGERVLEAVLRRLGSSRPS
jgi:hypothetical protein